MRRVTVVAATALLLALVGSGEAQEGIRPAGKVPIALGIFSAPGDTAVQDTLTLYVTARASKSRGRFGTVHISIPQGLTLVSGDTVFTTAVTSGLPPHRFTVHADEAGTYELRGVMEVATAPGESDLSEVSLSVVVEGGTLRPMTNVIHRLESTRNGRRFRMAGLWLVPMDEADVFDDVEFQHGGTRPQVVQGPSAACVGCATSDTVTFIVVVDKTGSVMQADPEGVSDTEAVEAAKAALSHWRFEPAHLRGQAIIDWTYVKVPVTTSR